jgi:hypothetical protein
MDTRASDVTPITQIICCCESPICSADHPARYQPLPLDGPGAPDLAWLLAARRSRVGMAAAMVRQRVVRRTPRHA